MSVSCQHRRHMPFHPPLFHIHVDAVGLGFYHIDSLVLLFDEHAHLREREMATMEVMKAMSAGFFPTIGADRHATNLIEHLSQLRQSLFNLLDVLVTLLHLLEGTTRITVSIGGEELVGMKGQQKGLSAKCKRVLR